MFEILAPILKVVFIIFVFLKVFILISWTISSPAILKSLVKIELYANSARINLTNFHYLKELFRELININLKAFLLKNIFFGLAEKVHLSESYKKGYEFSSRLFKPISEIINISKETFR